MSDLPADLSSVLDRMLAKARDDRYSTPAEVARDLQSFAQGSNLSRFSQTAQRRPRGPVQV